MGGRFSAAAGGKAARSWSREKVSVPRTLEKDPALRMRDRSHCDEAGRSGFGFPKQDRILLRSDFLAVTRKGRRFSTRFFLVFLRPNRHGRTRLGITVSRKIGKAVKRNFLKRRVREFFRLHRPLLPRSTDIVIIAKKGIPELSYRMICQDLDRFTKPGPWRDVTQGPGEAKPC